MKDVIVRLTKIQINNLKNVENGVIELASSKSHGDYFTSDIMGIYGQNGSGKTTVIDAIELLKYMLSGHSLPDEIINYISIDKDRSTCAFDFLICRNNTRVKVIYTFALRRNGNTFDIVSEQIKYKLIDDPASMLKVLMEYDNDKEQLLKPINQLNSVLSANSRNTRKQDDNEVDFKVAKLLAQKEKRSFFFSGDGQRIFMNNLIDPTIGNLILLSLRNYALANLFVVKNKHSAPISLDLGVPFSLRYVQEDGIVIGDIFVLFASPTVLPRRQFDILCEIIQNINIVLKTIVPDLELEIKAHGIEGTVTGDDGVRCEIFSKKSSRSIPLRYESEGIIKIISILNILIAMYNDPTTTVVIDELDCSIFEYLLGELLSIIEESGRGQLIFTSHNLRPLEKLNKNSLMFTTSNPANRYIRLSNIKRNNNLRSVYIRSINLGGQEEDIYDATERYKIRAALRRAGGNRNI